MYLTPSRAVHYEEGIILQTYLLLKQEILAREHTCWLVTVDGVSPDVGQFMPSAGGRQVWSLTQFFFLFPFCENSLICLEGKSMNPHRGNTIFFRSSQQLPRLRLGPLKGFLS